MLGCGLSRCAVGRAAAMQGRKEEWREELGSFHGGFYSAHWMAGWKETLKCIVLWRGSCSSIYTKRGDVIKCKVKCCSPAHLLSSLGPLTQNDFNLKCEARSCWSMKRGNQGVINRRAPQMIEFFYCTISFDLFLQPTFDKKLQMCSNTDSCEPPLCFSESFTDVLTRTHHSKCGQSWGA